jgi:hypothetical protein
MKGTVMVDGEEYEIVPLSGETLKEHFGKLLDLPRSNHCVDLREPVVIAVKRSDGATEYLHCSSIGGGCRRHDGKGNYSFIVGKRR